MIQWRIVLVKNHHHDDDKRDKKAFFVTHGNPEEKQIKSFVFFTCWNFVVLFNKFGSSILV